MSGFSAWYYRQMAVWSSFFKRDERALEYWDRLRALRPRDAKVVSTIAHLKAGAGERLEAIALLHRSLELNPQDATAWFNLGFLQQEEGEQEAALGSFERALKFDGKLDRAWYGTALALIKLGRVEEAIAPLTRNTELQPMSPFGWYQLAHVYHRLGDSKRVARVIRTLAEFEPEVARQLERETGVNAGVDIPFQPTAAGAKGAKGR